MQGSVLIIADLHLSAADTALAASFSGALDAINSISDLSQIIIAGDLFDVWLGDDSEDYACGVENRNTLQELSRNAPLTLMHGNRDFLVSERWAESIGATLNADDEIVITTATRNILLCHGDHLCINDHQYQAARTQFRDLNWQQQMLALPLEQRIALGEKLRQDSATQSSEFLAHWDVDQTAAIAAAKRASCNAVIHGHTHRPGHHASNGFDRWVLGSWGKDGGYGLIVNTDHGEISPIWL